MLITFATFFYKTLLICIDEVYGLLWNFNLDITNYYFEIVGSFETRATFLPKRGFFSTTKMKKKFDFRFRQTVFA